MQIFDKFVVLGRSTVARTLSHIRTDSHIIPVSRDNRPGREKRSGLLHFLIVLTLSPHF